jgi:DNA-binding transcriptional LysR family regulator
MVAELDLNLLRVFDALVTESSVTGAAALLHLSVPATSRALGRLRRAVADPVLVRAGRGLTPTPFATRTAPQVRALLEAAETVFTADRELDVATMERTFTIRINEGPAATLAPPLVRLISERAPRVLVRLLGEGLEDVEALRSGAVDLDVGAPRPAADLREETLYVEPLTAVVAAGSPAGRDGPLTGAQLCALPHVSASRRGRARGPLDDLLAEQGLHRRVTAVAGSFAVAAMMAAESDLVALVPRRLAARYGPALGLRSVELDVELPPIPITQQWHARLDVDPAQVWLRATVREAARMG